MDLLISKLQVSRPAMNSNVHQKAFFIHVARCSRDWFIIAHSAVPKLIYLESICVSVVK